MPTIPSGVQPIDLSYTVARLANRFLGTELQSRAFGPGVPLTPTVPQIEQQAPRQFQYPVATNTVLTPRREYPGLTPFEQLRNLAALYDVAALCIRTIQNIIAGLDYHIVAKDSKAQAAENGTCDALQVWFAKPDRVTSFDAWLKSALYDMLTLDAMTIYPHPDNGGGLWGLEVIDGATIKPLLDARGQTAAYQQILYGTPWSNYERPAPDTNDDSFESFSTRELFYLPRWTRTFTPYGFPPTEAIIIRVNTALRKQSFDLARFTDGNIPAALASPPDGLLNPEQVMQFEEAFNATLQGDDRARARIKFLPWAAKLEKLNDISESGNYETSLDEWLFKICCMAYDMPPQELGETTDINKATGGMQQNGLYRRCIIPTTTWLKRVVFDPAIQSAGLLNCPQLEWRWEFGEQEDKASGAKIEQDDVAAGVITATESRNRRYPDLDGPAPGPPAPAFGGAPAAGPFRQSY